MDAVFRRSGRYGKNGMDGLKTRKSSGRLPVVKDNASKIMPRTVEAGPTSL